MLQMGLSEGIAIALIGLALPFARVLSKKIFQGADIHLDNARALQKLILSIESLHEKHDHLIEIHADEDSLFATKGLKDEVKYLAKDIAFIKGKIS